MWQEVVKKEFKHKINKDEILLKTCPYCGNDHYNLQISISKAIWQCWACSAKGRIEKLFKDQNLPFDKTGWQSSAKVVAKAKSEALVFDKFVPIDYAHHNKFLDSKGIDKEDIYRYNLMTTSHGKYKSKLIIPLKEGNAVVYFVARNAFANGRYFNPIIDRKPLLLYYLGTENKLRLYLVEGAFDAISINKLGYSVAMLLGSGISREQIEKIKRFGFTEVVVCLDGDIPKVSVEVYKKLKKSGIKTKIIFIPGKDDPNDLYVADKEYLKKLLDNPKELTIEDEVKITLRKKGIE